MARNITALQDVCDFAEQHYGVAPRDLKLLLACLIRPYKGYQPVWLMIETKHNLFLNHLSYVVTEMGHERIVNVQLARYRPMMAASEMADSLNRDEPTLFLDPEWTKPVLVAREWTRSMYAIYTSRCVRARMDMDNWMIPPVDAREQLLQLVRAAVPREVYPRPQPPNAALQGYLRLLTMLNSELDNKSELGQNLCLVPTAHAALHRRDKLEEVDYFAQRRVLVDSVRWWTWEIVKVFVEGQGVSNIDEIVRATGIARMEVIDELDRMAEGGLLVWRKPKWKGRRDRWVYVGEEWRPELFAMAEGDAQWW